MIHSDAWTRILKACLVAGLLGVMLSGCTTYYQVTDTNSGKVYYTTKLKQAKASGAVTFQDARSGANVTVPASEYHKITEPSYKSGVSGAARSEDAGK